jgi:hypothetical protein
VQVVIAAPAADRAQALVQVQVLARADRAKPIHTILI